MRTREEILAKIEELATAGIGDRTQAVKMLKWVLGSCMCGHVHRGTGCTECGCQRGDGEQLNRPQPVETTPAAVKDRAPTSIERAHTEPVPEQVDDETVKRFKLLELD